MRYYRGLFTIISLGMALLLEAVPLKTIYDAAQPQTGFDKWVELETGVIYTGGLLIGSVTAPYNSVMFGKPGKDVKIKGNGAILDLQGSEIAISFCSNRLEIENCVIINGNVRYRGDLLDDQQGGFIDRRPVGSVKQVTFYNAQDFGVRISGAGEGITLERNLFFSTKDTGIDYSIYNGAPEPNLPTGINCAFSANSGGYGYPWMVENWSYHSRELFNGDPLYHFGLL